MLPFIQYINLNKLQQPKKKKKQLHKLINFFVQGQQTILFSSMYTQCTIITGDIHISSFMHMIRIWTGFRLRLRNCIFFKACV